MTITPMSLASERRTFTARLITPVPACSSCRQDVDPEVFTDGNVCERCAKAGEYLRAAVAGPDALRRLADQLEDALSERHEVAAAYMFARIGDALVTQVEAITEVAEAIAARPRSGRWPSLPYPSGWGQFERGVWVAPWRGPLGEIVLVAITGRRTVLGIPVTVPIGGDHVGAAEELWEQLGRGDPPKI